MGDDTEEFEIIRLEKRSKVSKAIGITASVFAGLASLTCVTSAVVHGIKHETIFCALYSLSAVLWSGISVMDIVNTKKRSESDKEQIKTLKKQAGINEDR